MLQNAPCSCKAKEIAASATKETDSRPMPEGGPPPGCSGGEVGVGIEVALGLVLMVGVVPFDGHAIRVLG